MKSLKKKLLTSSDPHKTILPDIYFDILSGIYSGIFPAKLFSKEEEERTTLMKSRDRELSSPPLAPGILSGKSSDILYGIFYLAYLRRFFVVEVRRGTL